MKNIKDIINSLLIYFYPDRCPFCESTVEKGQIACEKCLKELPHHGYTTGILGGYRCISALPYRDKYKKAILRFKSKNKTQYCDQLAALIFKQIQTYYCDIIFDYVTFVPMYTTDLHKRGYNQCELLARSVAKMMGIDCKDTLKKTKHTKPQHKTKGRERKSNLNGAFGLIDNNRVKGRSVLLLDDIVTTGSTLGECTKMLYKARPALICCVTLEKTIR